MCSINNCGTSQYKKQGRRGSVAVFNWYLRGTVVQTNRPTQCNNQIDTNDKHNMCA